MKDSRLTCLIFMKEKHEQSSSVTTATNELKLSPETSDVDNSEDVSNNS